MTDAHPPAGWPGELLLEGRTPFRLPVLESQRRHSLERGPGNKDERAVFHNSAMAASRTRSVLLLALAALLTLAGLCVRDRVK